jgi:hypothetical protein
MALVAADGGRDVQREPWSAAIEYVCAMDATELAMLSIMCARWHVAARMHDYQRDLAMTEAEAREQVIQHYRDQAVPPLEQEQPASERD